MKTIERFKDLKIGRRRSRCEPKAWQSQREIPRFTRNGVCNLLIVIALCSLLPALLYAQVDTAWVRRYNGPGNVSDYAKAIALDGTGNVYVTGYSTGSGTGYDYATIKYNSAGDTLWVRRYNGPGNGVDRAYAIAVDGSGNVYVTGYSVGIGTGDYDYATIKYNSDGVEQWVSRYNGPGNGADNALALAVDGAGNVYVTGNSLGSGTGADYATLKYNSAGVQQWVSRYNGPGNGDDNALALAVDGTGNVYVTGNSLGSGTAADYATLKYNSDGVEQWVSRYNGPGNVFYDYPYAIAVDGTGNVYVTGQSPNTIPSGTYADYATIKYNSAGVEQWVARYNGPGNDYDYANAIAVDGTGNVYVTGESPITFAGMDYTTIKYNSAGDTLWVRSYNGPGNGVDWAFAIAVDGVGNVYVTGNSSGGAAPGTGNDYATIKYVPTPGVEEVRGQMQEVRELKVYPNPARSFFIIRLPQLWSATTMSLHAKSPILHSKIRMFDVSGKVIKVEELKGSKVLEYQISLNGIKNGVYFVQVGNEMVKEKLVVTR